MVPVRRRNADDHKAEKGRVASAAFLFVDVPEFPGPALARPDPRQIRSASGAQVVGRRLARAAIRHDLVRDLLAFTQRSKPGTLDGADMYEHIVAAVIRLDEAVALGCVEPLHGSHAHGIVPSQISNVETHFWRAGEIEFLEGSSAPEPAVPVDS